jgi:hypothetical protein
MDITPSQPAQNPTVKADPTMAANSNKKQKQKKSKPYQAQKAAPVAQPVDDPILQPTMPPVEAIEEQILEDMDGMIATAAYYLAERRNFAPGHELEDWLAAEQQIRK